MRYAILLLAVLALGVGGIDDAQASELNHGGMVDTAQEILAFNAGPPHPFQAEIEAMCLELISGPVLPYCGECHAVWQGALACAQAGDWDGTYWRMVNELNHGHT